MTFVQDPTLSGTAEDLLLLHCTIERNRKTLQLWHFDL